jgi:hypothetical protein
LVVWGAILYQLKIWEAKLQKAGSLEGLRQQKIVAEKERVDNI